MHPEILGSVFSKLGTTYNEFSETVLTGKTRRFKLYFDISFVKKLVFYCPG